MERNDTTHGEPEYVWPAKHVHGNNPGVRVDDHAKTSGPPASSTFSYYGGPILDTATCPAGLAVNLVWYGSWAAGDAATVVIPALVTGLTNSTWWSIVGAYTNSKGKKASTILSVGKQVFLPTSAYGATLSDALVQTIVQNAGLAASTCSVSLVLGAGDVEESSGFCTQYCGWHSYYKAPARVAAKYGFIGSPSRCYSGCSALSSAQQSPNGDQNADAMASIIAHELAEAATDPQFNAWYDGTTGAENADKCAWTFGAVSQTASGAYYNVVLSNGYKFLLQQDWRLSDATCALTA